MGSEMCIRDSAWTGGTGRSEKLAKNEEKEKKQLMQVKILMARLAWHLGKKTNKKTGEKTEKKQQKTARNSGRNDKESERSESVKRIRPVTSIEKDKLG